jgi:hypothetical protein
MAGNLIIRWMDRRGASLQLHNGGSGWIDGFVGAGPANVID